MSHKLPDPLGIVTCSCGATVTMVYALDELKALPAAGGSMHYARTVLEVTISFKKYQE